MCVSPKEGERPIAAVRLSMTLVQACRVVFVHDSTGAFCAAKSLPVWGQNPGTKLLRPAGSYMEHHSANVGNLSSEGCAVSRCRATRP